MTSKLVAILYERLDFNQKQKKIGKTQTNTSVFFILHVFAFINVNILFLYLTGSIVERTFENFLQMLGCVYNIEVSENMYVSLYVLYGCCSVVSTMDVALYSSKSFCLLAHILFFLFIVVVIVCCRCCCCYNDSDIRAIFIHPLACRRVNPILCWKPSAMITGG